MCGIFAAVAPADHPACHFAPRAVHLLKHRGPDAQGTLHLALPFASVTLGMSRLKIVDQTDIPVPFDFRDNFGVVIAFNGEIYNWRELRAALPPQPWKTNCDVEVLAALWRRDGSKCLDLLNGMFAFVLVDVQANVVHAVRDRAGEKPLYHAQRGSVVYYASEPKAFPLALRECPCPDMDVLEFDCGRVTPLEHVFAVPPGERQKIVGKSGQLWRTEHTWWKLPQERPEHRPHARELTQIVAEARETFVDAAKLRNVAERQVAIQLSGGLDSAMTEAVVLSDHAYCVTFPGELDNMRQAQEAMAPRSRPDGLVPDVHPITFTREELLEALPMVAYALDTPGTWTAVAQWFLNRKIAEDGGIIVLSGEGADELWGGYVRYRVLHWLDVMTSDPHLEGYTPLLTRSLGGPPSKPLAATFNRGSAETLPWAEHLIMTHGGQGSYVHRMMRADFYTTMQVLVRMADRTSAAFGLENRSPFFDYRLMELAARLPTTTHVTAQESKSILRHAARGLGVHWSITDEKTKRGLTVPMSWGNGSNWSRDWFATEMLDAWRKACLRPALCQGCGA